MQVWQDSDLAGGSSIQAELGGTASTPRGLVLTVDTEYNEASERFSTVDALLYTSPTRPADWFEVHHIDGFPGAMFPPSTRLDFDQRDAFTYTARRSEMGLLERLPTFTHQPRPLNALYIQSKQSWALTMPL